VRDLHPQVFVHLAAVAQSTVSNKDPYSTFDHSFRTLENALDAARFLARSGTEHFIYLSSSMVYGNFTSDEVTEESPCEPVGIYGALKFGGEKLVIAYNQVFGLPFTIVRPSAVYGERDVGQRVVQKFIESALVKKPITIDGDGSDSMDFTYVQDVVSGLIKVIENDGSRNQIFNLTYGQGRSLRELANVIQNHFPEVDVQYKTRDRLMPKRGTLSIEKARRLLGYEPMSPLEDGMGRYITWYASQEFAAAY
jgi:nucleoside-diphosphate-sugar epimerase